MTHTHDHSMHSHGASSTISQAHTFRDFVPLIVIFLVIILFTIIMHVRFNGDVLFAMRNFMAGFFIVFGAFKPLAHGRFRCSLCSGPKGIIGRSRVKAHRNSHKDPKPARPRETRASRYSASTTTPRITGLLRAHINDRFSDALCPHCMRRHFDVTPGKIRCINITCGKEFEAYK